MNIMSRFWSNVLLLNHVTIKRRGCLLVIYTATLVNGIKMFNLYLREAMNCYTIAKRLGLKKVSKYIHVFKYPLGHIYLKNTQHIIHTFSISFVFSFIIPYIHDSIYTLFIANLFEHCNWHCRPSPVYANVKTLCYFDKREIIG